MSVWIVAQSSSEIPEGLMNNPVHLSCGFYNITRLESVVTASSLSQ